jgi:hypothetical protein
MRQKEQAVYALGAQILEKYPSETEKSREKDNTDASIHCSADRRLGVGLRLG